MMLVLWVLNIENSKPECQKRPLRRPDAPGATSLYLVLIQKQHSGACLPINLNPLIRVYLEGGHRYMGQ